MDRPLWQIPLRCADVVDAFEASLLCPAGVTAKRYHLASKQASVAKEHNVCFVFEILFITLLYIVI